jgi:hypothetical protein
MPELMKLKRISGYAHLDDKEPCYWKDKDGWWLYLPLCGIGRLSNHQVEEHQDGTITANPSIKMTGHHYRVRHGYVKRSVWEPCEDDNTYDRAHTAQP